MSCVATVVLESQYVLDEEVHSGVVSDLSKHSVVLGYLEDVIGNNGRDVWQKSLALAQGGSAQSELFSGKCVLVNATCSSH